jgi:cyclic-di-GMP-binding protein
MEDPRTVIHLLTAEPADLNSLHTCQADPDAINVWVAALPMANLLASTTQLLELVGELCRLRTDYLTRLELLESIRSTVYYMSARIERNNVSGGTRWNPQLEQAQSLQQKLATGYKNVVLAALPILNEDKSAREAVINGLHRAISDLSRILLRSHRHYLTPDTGIWLQLNQLFHIARSCGLTEQKVRDSENHNQAPTTILEAWMRPVLVALAKPNQLRPMELNQLFNALETWSGQAEVRPAESKDLFTVDLRQDRPPASTAQIRSNPALLGLNTEVLAYELEAFLREIPSSVVVPEFVGAKVLQHVASAWSTAQVRQHQRLPLAESVEIGIGLRVAAACFAYEIETARTKASTEQTNRTKTSDAPTPVNGPTVHITQARDTSPLGFNVQWPEGLPASAQIGELLSVKEASSDQWRIGVLRWIGGSKGGTATTGVELLSPTAVPVSARVVKTKGGSTAFAKALLLPALPAMQRPASLITPRVPFQPMQKIQIQRGRTQSNIHLGSCIGQTENYNQFSFRMLGSYLENQPTGLTMNALTQSQGANRSTNEK